MRNRVRLLEGGSKGQSSAEPARWRRSHIPSARRLEPVHVALFRDPISAAGLRASRIPSWFWLSPARPRPIWLQPHCIQLPFTLTSDVNPRPQQGLRLSAFLTRAGQNSPDTQAKAVSHPDRVSRWNSCPASAPTEAGSPGLSRPGLCRPQGLAGTQESAFRTAYMTVK
ncbi:unnamed protein product [Rangifer tarandus platyrhynchus]|uniref:Uncharacterized protein n=1 Tax=Rangifer tarandus platyrhynchus TaxID=3082113 RepID=A0ACB1MJY7_RANTA